jgi:hypothetical protein
MGLLTRRRLLGSAFVVAAGGAGLAVGATRPRHRPVRTPPTLLLDAVDRERTLVALLDAAIPTAGTAAAVMTSIRADHDAHRSALQALVDQASSPRSTPSPAPLPPSPPSRADLAAAETSAQTAAATASAAATSGALAALLASISACEAGHVVLLS